MHLRALAGALALAALTLIAPGCGGVTGRPAPKPTKPTATTPVAPPPAGPAFGITEDNADLLWAPGASAPAQAAPFAEARRWLAALRPRFFRLLVDWAALQPAPGSRPALSAPVDGCARGVAPCGSYPGVEGELAAIASQQREARARGEAVPQVEIDLLGAPAWAALPPHGCERAGTSSSARALRDEAIGAYKALIASLLALVRREGVSPPWWSPWNEPNDPRFLSPQRGSCGHDGVPAAPAVYATLARAMGEELRAQESGRMLLGELGGYETGSPHRLSVAEFVASVPADVLCLGAAWGVHAYASHGRASRDSDPVAALETALDARGGCAAAAPIWITEAGAGAARPGSAGGDGAGEEQAACLALASQLLAWRSDPRVRAVLQYTFRDDPAFPVGLASADLRRLSRTYGLWMREPAALPGTTASALCAGSEGP